MYGCRDISQGTCRLSVQAVHSSALQTVQTEANSRVLNAAVFQYHTCSGQPDPRSPHSDPTRNIVTLCPVPSDDGYQPVFVPVPRSASESAGLYISICTYRSFIDFFRQSSTSYLPGSQNGIPGFDSWSCFSVLIFVGNVMEYQCPLVGGGLSRREHDADHCCCLQYVY
jgi:hypothetical protein